MLRVSGAITDEGFSGSRVRDTRDKNRYTKQGAEFLASTVRTATGSAPASRTNTNKISTASSSLFNTLADNTEKVQTLLENQSEETRSEIKKLISMMSAAQKKTGDASVKAINELVRQVEVIKMQAGDEGESLADQTGLNEAQKILARKNKGETVTGKVFRKFMKTDRGLGVGASIRQAFTMEKMFGLDPKPLSGEKLIQQQRAELEEKAALEAQADAQSEVMEAVTPDSEAAPPQTNTETIIEKNAEGGATFITGTDRESLDNKQVELLEDILKQLKKMESLGSNNSLLPDIDIDGPFPGTTTSDRGRKNNKKPGRFGRIGRGLGTVAATVFSPSVLALAATVAAPIALGVYLAQKNSDPLPDGPERTIRGPGGRVRTTTAPLNYRERQNMEEYGTIDREEIQKIQMERAGYTQPDVVQSAPITQLSSSDIKEKQKNSPALIEAVKNMPEAAREAFLQSNPHMRPVVESYAYENPMQSSETSALADIGTNPIDNGAGVLSMEAQGLDPVVTPTADAVGNVSDLMQTMSQATIINNNYYTTNNNQSAPSQTPIIVAPSNPRNLSSPIVENNTSQTAR